MFINSIYAGINGEVSILGQGSLCTFIRLQGCNLRCKYCFGVVPGRHIPKIILSDKPNKKLTDIKIGDKLLTFNDKKELVETEVTNLITREVDSWLKIRIKNYEYYVTEEHPFFTTQGLKQAKDLQIGDEIYHSDYKDKLSFRMIGNKNPMEREDVKKRVIENTNYKLLGKKISSAIKRKQIEGTYVSSYDSLSKEDQQKVGKKISLSKMGNKNPNWKGGSKTPNYDEMKQQIKNGETRVCSKCRKEKPLDVHHKDGNHKNDSSENLEILCESCHYTEHEIGYNFWKNNNRKDGKQLIAMNGFKILSIKKINRNDYPPSLKPKPLKVYNLSCEPYNSFLIDYMWVHNCDTKQAQKVNKKTEFMSADVIHNCIINGYAEDNIFPKNLTITGGEPLMQEKEVLALARMFQDNLYTVCIETNGSYRIPYTEYVDCWIVDWKSPSSGMRSKMKYSNFMLVGKNDFVKFTIKNRKDFDDATECIEELYKGRESPKFAFSPQVSKNPDKDIFKLTLIDWMLNSDICVETKAILNLQIHKIIGTA